MSNEKTSVSILSILALICSIGAFAYSYNTMRNVSCATPYEIEVRADLFDKMQFASEKLDVITAMLHASSLYVAMLDGDIRSAGEDALKSESLRLDYAKEYYMPELNIPLESKKIAECSFQYYRLSSDLKALHTATVNTLSPAQKTGLNNLSSRFQEVSDACSDAAKGLMIDRDFNELRRMQDVTWKAVKPYSGNN